MRIKRRKAVLAWLLAFSMILPMFSSVIPSKAIDAAVPAGNNYDEMTIEQILSQDKSLTWVFAGDSITHNGTYTRGMNSYSEWFEQYLYDIGRGDDSVVLTAWGGANTYDFQYEKDTPDGYGPKVDKGKGLENMITKYNPDVVFLKLGMNERYKTTANFVRTYNQILDGVYAEGAKNNKIPKIILLSSTPLVNETIYDDMVHQERGEKISDSVLRSRNEIAKVAEERNLMFCDLRTAFLEESVRLGEDYARTFYSDGSDGAIHPNAAGQYYIFLTLSKTLGIYKEELPIFQVKYEDLLSRALYTDDTCMGDEAYKGDEALGEYYGSTSGWESSITENYVWAVAGAKQMSGYEGPVVHHSLFRYLDNAMRAKSGTAEQQCRDIRLFNFASPDYENGVKDLLAKYDEIMAARDYDVFLLLPEIPNVYEKDYVHSPEKVAEYKNNVIELLSKNDGKVKILWTPLAAGDSVINSYIDEYAEVVRDIVAADSSILFFDANQFMNDKMAENEALVRNWFEDGAYVSPLCALDVARAFYILMGQDGISITVLKNYNLRFSHDTQVFKSNYISDYVKADASVSGTKVTVDVNEIKKVYPDIKNLKLVGLPEKATGNYHADIRDLSEVTEVTKSEDIYTFEAPCADLHLAIYGEQNGLVYRFKDISLTIETNATIPERKVVEPDGVYLDSLKVMSALDFGFDKTITEYTVDLYQYQTFARVRATAQAGLTITVNGKAVESNALSEPIQVKDGSTITVSVSDGKDTKTYTLTCAKPEQPDIIITEVMQDGYLNATQTGGDNYELVEIYNASGKDLNLLDYSLGFKKDWTYNYINIEDGAEYPYYFTGNDQAFGGESTYTGIKPITKYSVYWTDKVNNEPQEVIFPADSTMVIWIKSASQLEKAAREAYSAALTYDTLIESLTKNKDTHTLSIDVDGQSTVVVPKESQLVVAEVPVDTQTKALSNRAKVTASKANTNYELENFSEDYSKRPSMRGWLFLLKKGATFAENGAITQAGDDIISAAKFSRVTKSTTGTDKLSSVLSYNYDRGMSLVKNENVVKADKIGVGNTSDVMGYSNLTSFGAIEYWQKPTDFGDESVPTIVDNTIRSAGRGSSVTFNFDLADNQDVRYVELYMRRDGETEFTKVSKDFVLEAGVKNAGKSEDIKSVAYTHTVDNIGEQIEYYAKVVDGNNNEATVGSETEPLAITTLREVQAYSGEEALTYFGENAPECKSAGYVFAGWYADEACEKTPIRNAEQMTETAYALFVTENVLSVKAQLSADVLSAGTNATKADIRFVTTVDTLKYKEVGFKLVIKGKEATSSTNTVYTELYALGTDGVVDKFSPKYFSLASNYFAALTVTGIPAGEWDTGITVTPYWVTLDGTTVYGMEATKTVNEGRSECVAQIGTTVYGTLAEALEAAKDNDVIEVLRDTTIDETFTIDKKLTLTNVAGSSVTLTRADSLADAMFNITSRGSLTIACTGENTITVDGNQVEATSSMIVNEGTFELGANAGLINGKIAAVGDTSNYGGALKNEKTGTVSLAGKVNGNTAPSGGAVYNFGGTVTVKGGEFKNNKTMNDPQISTYGRAGAIYTHNNGTTVIENGMFENNTATGQIGGGVFGGTGYSTLEIKGGTFQNNSAVYTGTKTVYGGGVIQSAGKVTISGGTFSNNTALQGGVIYMDKGTNAKLSIQGGVFTGNKAEGTAATGGVIYNASNNLEITGGKFAENYAYYRGGVMYIASDTCAAASISNATFEKNSVDGVAGKYHGGGVLYVTGTADGQSVVNIQNCSFSQNGAKNVNNNTGTGLGGAIYNTSAYQLNMADSAFSSNNATLGGAIYLNTNTTKEPKDTEKSSMTLNNCTFTNNTAYSCPDVYDNYGAVSLAGKVIVKIGLNSTAANSMIYVNELLAEQSSIEVRAIQSARPRAVGTFKNADIMNACKGYFYLINNAAHNNCELQFANNKATVVAK